METVPLAPDPGQRVCRLLSFAQYATGRAKLQTDTITIYLYIYMCMRIHVRTFLTSAYCKEALAVKSTNSDGKKQV